MGLVAVCEILTMICEIASVNDNYCYFDRILSSLFRRLALGIIILIFVFVEKCHFRRCGCRVDIRRFACCHFGRICSYQRASFAVLVVVAVRFMISSGLVQ